MKDLKDTKKPLNYPLSPKLVDHVSKLTPDELNDLFTGACNRTFTFKVVDYKIKKQ